MDRSKFVLQAARDVDGGITAWEAYEFVVRERVVVSGGWVDAFYMQADAVQWVDRLLARGEWVVTDGCEL